MSSDLQRSLENASVGPASPLDMKRVYESARKRTRIVRTGMIGGLVVAALASGGMYRAMGIGQTGERPVGPVGSPSPSTDDDEECFYSEGETSGEKGTEIHARICPQSTAYVDDDDRVSVQVPRGWQVASENLTPNLEDPREILSLGTSPLLPGGSCARQSARTLDAIGPNDAFISVKEGRTSSKHEPRPPSFRDELENRFFNFKACTDTRDFSVYLYGFNDEGRDLHLFAALGNRAGRARTDEFWRTIESLDFSPDISTREMCGPPPVQPTYLPWLEDGNDVPPPAESYDEALDRYQQSWSDPRSPEVAVGLTLGPSRDGEGGEAMNLFVQGTAAYLHEGEGGSSSISWALDRRCNFLELTFTDPELTRFEIEEELIRTARSLEKPRSGEDAAYRPPRFRPLQGWFTSSQLGEEGGAPSAWASTLHFGDHLNPQELPNLGPADVALHAQLVTPSDYMNYPLRYFPERDLPLKLDDAKIHKSFLEQWDEDIPVRVLQAHVQGHRLMVRIYFGTSDPTPEMLEQAGAQLRRLQLPPSWET